MRYKIKFNELCPDMAYGNHYYGYEMIFLVKKKDRLRYFLFENKMALLGFWMDDSQISKIVEIMLNEVVNTLKPSIDVGDEIHIESFKHRNSTFNERGHLLATADVVRVLNIVDTEKK